MLNESEDAVKTFAVGPTHAHGRNEELGAIKHDFEKCSAAVRPKWSNRKVRRAGSTAARPHRVVGAAKIDQVLRRTSLQTHNAAEQYIVRADRGDGRDLAVEGNRTVGENGCTRFERRPHRRREPFPGGHLA